MYEYSDALPLPPLALRLAGCMRCRAPAPANPFVPRMWCVVAALLCACSSALRAPVQRVRRSAVPRSAAVEAPPPLTPGAAIWDWDGSAIRYSTSGAGPAVVLLHGFGSSLETWRGNEPALVAAGYEVHRLDFLGLGLSAKAPGAYSIDRWTDQVEAYLDAFDIAEPPVLVGNSIGSLVSLNVAARRRVRGLCLCNCAGGMNSKFSGNDPSLAPAARVLAAAAFGLLDAVLALRPLASYVFDAVRNEDNVRSILSNVYVDGGRVDDLLVESTLRPADDPRALDVFVAILTGDPGPTPADLVPETDAPIHCIWGEKDQITPLSGLTGVLFQNLERAGRCTFTRLDAGHVPHDDDVESANAALLAWLGSIPPQ